MGKIKVNAAFGAALLSLSMVLPSAVHAQQYVVENRFHQSAAPNREEADITVIRCGGRQYYIYGYYRSSGPRYRAIIPPYWGNPVGGQDHYQFEQAVRAACY